MRLLVHEPMNTVSTAMSRIGVPAVRPMYSSARAADSRSLASANESGSGTASPIGTTWAGFVPQETCGAIAAPSSTTSLSKVAPSSVGSVASRRAPPPRPSPLGAWVRPSR